MLEINAEKKLQRPSEETGMSSTRSNAPTTNPAVGEADGSCDSRSDGTVIVPISSP
jgi:hypothetical protein